MRRLCFVAPPFAGHLNPMVGLAHAARDAGHEVEVITGPAKVPALRAAGLDARTLTVLAGDELEAIANTTERVGSNPFRLAGQMRAAFEVMAEARDELVELWRGQPPDLVVADFAAVAAGLAADAVGRPWITTMRAAFMLEGFSGPPSYLGGLRPVPGWLGALRDRAGWTAIRLGKDALAFCFRKPMTQLGLRRRRADGAEALYSPYRIIVTEMAELEFERRWPPAVRFIGPLLDDPEPATAFRPPPSPRVLVSLGTHLPWAKRTLVAEIQALSARLPAVNFVVSMGDPVRAAEAPMQVSPRVAVHQYVSYHPHLSAFDAVIHHGGAGVTSACIAAGRPAVVAPQDYDQFDYAARIEHHGLGVRVRKIGSRRTADALNTMLQRPPEAVSRFAERARAYEPRAAFLAEVEAVLSSAQGRS